MSATISALYPPPQSIDSLDQWGSLDGLLWSLDDAVWTTCGVYGLTSAEDAQSAGAAQGSTIVNGVLDGAAAAAGALEGEVVYDAGTLPGSATATQGLAGNRIRRGIMGGDAEASQSILGGCVVNGDQVGFAESFGVMVTERIMYAEALGHAVSLAEYAYALTMDDFLAVDAAQSGDSIFPGCVVNGDQEGSADASGSLQALRIMVAEALGHAEASADYAYALTMDDFLAVDAAQSGDSIFPEYKGWTWRKDAQGGSTWTPEAAPGAGWAQLTGGAAVWDVLPQDDAPWQQVTEQAQPWTAAI